jgi:hypothetical protein
VGNPFSRATQDFNRRIDDLWKVERHIASGFPDIFLELISWNGRLRFSTVAKSNILIFSTQRTAPNARLATQRAIPQRSIAILAVMNVGFVVEFEQPAPASVFLGAKNPWQSR